MIRIPFALLAAALLTACASSAQIADRNNQRCVNRGYQPGTPDFEKCLGVVDNDRQTRVDARRQEWMEKSGSPFAR